MAPAQPSPPSWIEKIASTLLRPYFAGIGCIAALHRVLPEAQRSRTSQNRALETTPADLRAILDWVRRSGFDVIRLDELRGRLAEPRGAKFICFTIDDGYRDTLAHALPIFREFGFPFALYLTTGFLDRTTRPWWCYLEKVLLEREHIEFHWEGRVHSWRWQTDAERTEVFSRWAPWIETADTATRHRLLEALAHASGLDPAATCDPLVLTWEDIATLAGDWHATLGIHGTPHPAAAALDAAGLDAEWLGPKRELEARIGRPVHHFAYPSEKRSRLGVREIEAVRDADYFTAVTSKPGNLFPKHAWHMLSLPRLFLDGTAPALPHFRRLESGYLPASQNRWKRFVTT
jgi:peptidoglycan/xylan/chitin deacetylase (PgdA/CDA1 family)